VGLSNSDPGARQIFLDPATVDGSLAVGNPMVPLDACDSTDTDNTCLFDDPEIQALLGIRDPTGACPGWDGATDNYCLTFIDSVLVAANAASGVTTSAAKAERATLMFLKWIRGYDVFNEAATSPAPVGTTTTVQRKWLMGDVLHSRPLAVNYGARPPGGGGYGTLNQDVRLVFGSNDGMLRMVRNTETGAADPSATTQRGTAYGAEVWAFMPRELLAHVPELAKNFGNVGLNRPYGADGQPTLFTIDTNGDGIIDNDGSCAVGDPDCDRAWVYFGLRRGGKSYYAVDISNPDATTPNLLWKVNEGTTGFTELGMTFSSPRVGWVRFEDVVRTPRLNLFLLDGEEKNVPVPVAIFGGGYNGHAVTSGDHHHSGTGGPSKDTILDTPFIGADTNEGNAIFIVHARTGELIWKATLGTAGATATNYQNASMEHGIAAPVSPMDSDGNGMLDRLYVADTGGRVWRVDIPEFVPPSTPAPACLSTSADATTRFSTCDHRADTWKATVMADLRPTTTAGLATDDLRFFHGATIIRRARDDIRTYDAIAVGSGDREHPQSEVSKRNWFFLFKDPFITSGDPLVTDTSTTPFPYDATSGADGLHDVTDDCFNGASGGGCDAADLENGWKLALEETGEKNLSESFAGGNGIIFTTYLPQGTGPDDAQCVPLGASRLYQVSLESGAPLKFLHDVVGDSFSKTDRWINLYSGIDGGVVAVSPDHWITSSGKSGENPPQKQVGFYWRESGVDTVK
jgi:type IV pilus assembly protein PilY1